MRFEHSVCHGSLMTTYITLLALLVEQSLVHWYQQCVTVHHVPKCISCHKAIVVITGRAHCIVFMVSYIYVSIYVYIDMSHHFILLRLNPFDLRVDSEGWWLEHSVS